MVAVHVTIEDPGLFPFTRPGTRAGSGSGFVIDEEGRIITNYHVVVAALAQQSTDIRPGASITVSFQDDGGRDHPVRIRGANPDFDLALLELEEPGDAPGARPFVLADSDLVEAGQNTIAIGSPFGLHATALAELPERPRIGLSVPLTVDDYPDRLRAELELPDHGLVVTNVSPGGPADRAGLQAPTDVAAVAGQLFPVGGDIITAVDGEPLRRVIDLQRVVLQHEAGDALELRVWREGAERTVEVTLEVVAPPS